jgi:tetratricopeptide (TPR) repeat protein
MFLPTPADIPGLYQKALGLQKAGDADGALAIYRGILETAPGQAEVLFQVGRVLAEKGALAEAEKMLRAALKAKPKEPAIWQALHSVLGDGARRKLEREAQRAKIPLGSSAEARPILDLVRKGQAEEALKQAMALSRLAPLAAAPVHAVGAARAALGQRAQALAAFEEAVRRDPENPVFLVDLGRGLAAAERPEAGLARLREAEALGGVVAVPLARVLGGMCRDDDAVAVLRAAVERQRSFESLAALSLAEAALREADAALWAFGAAMLTPAARQRPNAREGLRRSLAAALMDAGEVEAAIGFLTAEAEASPDHAGILTQRGQARQTAGDIAGAEEDLRRATELAPAEPEAYRAYANGRRTDADDPVALRLSAQLARPDLPAPARRVMSFAAAKFAADRRDVAAEIEHLNRANRLMAGAFPYGFEADLATARQLAGDWAQLEGLAASGPEDPVLFVTGLPRSGTTLVETILAAHPDVTAGGEMPYLQRALAPAMEALRQGTADPERFAEAGRRYLVAAHRRAGEGRVVADKAISTFSRMGHAAAALPGARFVVLRRDPRDTGLSLWRNMFPEGLHRYAYDQTRMARYIRLHEALVSFWAERLPDRVHVVDYEALTENPEPAIRELVAFAGLSWDDACLAPQSAQRTVATLSFAQVRQPIGRGSVGGWRRFEAGLGALIEELDRSTQPDLLASD